MDTGYQFAMLVAEGVLGLILLARERLGEGGIRKGVEKFLSWAGQRPPPGRGEARR